MDTLHLVDPELLGVIDNFPKMEMNAGSLQGPRDMARTVLSAQQLPPLPVHCREIQIPSRDHDRTIGCLLIQPDEQPSKTAAILHFHGGGHVMGQPQMNQPELMNWANELGCLILSVDYRLAPETPFPGPMNDAYDALRWLNQQSAVLGIDPQRIAVAGSSAGGAMAACLSIMARDHGEFPIAFQLLEAPRLDDKIQRQGGHNPYTGEFIWTREASAFCWNAYLGTKTPSAYASAARAEDLSNLPPAFVSVGALDLFVDECLDYTSRLIRSGVSTELIIYPGCFHGFQLAKEAAVTIRSQDDTLRALKNALI